MRHRVECSCMMTGEETNESQVLAGTSDNPPGLAGIDTCCGLTVHGRPWREKFVKELKLHHLEPTVRAVNSRFRGIGGSTVVKEENTFPVGIFGNDGEITSAEVEQDAPLLLSRTHQRALGVNIYGDDTIDIENLGVTGESLKSATAHGHPAISLLDFSDSGRPGLDTTSGVRQTEPKAQGAGIEVYYKCRAEFWTSEPTDDAH